MKKIIEFFETGIWFLPAVCILVTIAGIIKGEWSVIGVGLTFLFFTFFAIYLVKDERDLA